jgi:hypothetical protein
MYKYIKPYTLVGFEPTRTIGLLSDVGNAYCLRFVVRVNNNIPWEAAVAQCTSDEKIVERLRI